MAWFIFEIQKTPWNQLADVQTLALLGARLLLWTDTTLSLPSEEPVMIPSWQTASVVKLKMLDHFDEFKSRKAMQVRRYHKVKIRCFKKSTPLFPKRAWNISKDKTKLPVPLGFSRFCVCIHFNFKAITMASAIFTIASTDMGWPLMRSWWSTSRSVHVEGVSKKKHRNVPSKKRGNLMWDPNDSALCFRKIEAYICW